MTRMNEVMNPTQLVTGDRIILTVGYADVLSVKDTTETETVVEFRDSDGDHHVLTLENTLLLEVERTDS